jgi:hypothetical protein
MCEIEINFFSILFKYHSVLTSFYIHFKYHPPTFSLFKVKMGDIRGAVQD